MSVRIKRTCLMLGLWCALLECGCAAAQAEFDSLFDLSFDALSSIPVISVSGVESRLAESPAAIYVVTPEEIRRTGLTPLPEVFRVVPGAEVARQSSNIWAVTARGENQQFANELLVLVDGRIVYDPVFSGVLWDQVDSFLPDIERIEFIRGPGATLWGSNANNGVVNVISKAARDTQGLYWDLTVGERQSARAALRYGGSLSEQGFYRIYVSHEAYGAQWDYLSDQPAQDAWEKISAGWRVDFDLSPWTQVTLQGDGHYADKVPINKGLLSPSLVLDYNSDQRLSGMNVLVKWSHQHPTESAEWFLRAYYDINKRHSSMIDSTAMTPAGSLPVMIDPYSETVQARYIQYQYHRSFRTLGEIVAGVSYREIDDIWREEQAFLPSSNVVLGGLMRDPEKKARTYGIDLQDTWHFYADKLGLTLGSKFEKNAYTGWEVQPSIRVGYRDERWGYGWGAVSRAIRVSNRVEEAFVIYGSDIGNPDMDNEKLVATEVGYRKDFWSRYHVDLAAFYNRYFDMIPSAQVGVQYNNRDEFDYWGLESLFRWQASPSFRLQASYSYLGTNRQPTWDPSHQFKLLAYYDITRAWSLNTMLYRVGPIGDLKSPLSNHGIPAYQRLDITGRWQPVPSFTLNFFARNLLDKAHLEFTDPFFFGRPIEIRSDFGVSMVLEL